MGCDRTFKIKNRSASSSPLAEEVDRRRQDGGVGGNHLPPPTTPPPLRGTSPASGRIKGANDLLKGRITKFSLDALINHATLAGLDAKVKVGKAA